MKFLIRETAAEVSCSGSDDAVTSDRRKFAGETLDISKVFGGTVEVHWWRATKLKGLHSRDEVDFDTMLIFARELWQDFKFDGAVVGNKEISEAHVLRAGVETGPVGGTGNKGDVD